MLLQRIRGGNLAKCFISREYLAPVCLYDGIYLAVLLRIPVGPQAQSGVLEEVWAGQASNNSGSQVDRAMGEQARVGVTEEGSCYRPVKSLT